MSDDTTETNGPDVTDAPNDKPRQFDDKGKFAKGNTLGIGRQTFAERRTKVLRQTILNAVSNEQMEQVTQSLVKLAIEGDVAAIRLLYEYTVGKPQAIEAEIETTETPGQLVINLVSPSSKN